MNDERVLKPRPLTGPELAKAFMLDGLDAADVVENLTQNGFFASTVEHFIFVGTKRRSESNDSAIEILDIYSMDKPALKIKP